MNVGVNFLIATHVFLIVSFLDPYGGDNVHNTFFFVPYFLRQQH